MACPPWADFIQHTKSQGALIPARVPFDRLLWAGPTLADAPAPAPAREPGGGPGAGPGTQPGGSRKRKPSRTTVEAAEEALLERDSRRKGFTGVKRGSPEPMKGCGDEIMGRKRPRNDTAKPRPESVPQHAPPVLEQSSIGDELAWIESSRKCDKTPAQHAAEGTERHSTRRAAALPNVTSIANPSPTLRMLPGAPALAGSRLRQ